MKHNAHATATTVRPCTDLIQTTQQPVHAIITFYVSHTKCTAEIPTGSALT